MYFAQTIYTIHIYYEYIQNTYNMHETVVPCIMCSHSFINSIIYLSFYYHSDIYDITYYDVCNYDFITYLPILLIIYDINYMEYYC